MGIGPSIPDITQVKLRVVVVVGYIWSQGIYECADTDSETQSVKNYADTKPSYRPVESHQILSSNVKVNVNYQFSLQ